MNPSSDLVNKLWRLCALLRKDGVTYQQYVTELTYLLFLKMMAELKREDRIPAGMRWKDLAAASSSLAFIARSSRRWATRRSISTAPCRRSSPTPRPSSASP
jgi:type I restriction-modification system DNA methylase subunit